MPNVREAAFARARNDNPVPPEAHQRHRVDYSLMRTSAGQWTYRYDRALRDANNKRARQSVEEGWQSVANINVPTLLVRGSDSNILSARVAQKMLDTLSDGHLQEVAGSGHPVPLDKPDAFLESVRTFL